jgi:hypothetical protein
MMVLGVDVLQSFSLFVEQQLYPDVHYYYMVDGAKYWLYWVVMFSMLILGGIWIRKGKIPMSILPAIISIGVFSTILLEDNGSILILGLSSFLYSVACFVDSRVASHGVETTDHHTPTTAK